MTLDDAREFIDDDARAPWTRERATERARR